MAFRKTRGFKSRGAYKARKVRRAIKYGGLQMYKRIFNIHKFKRLGESALINNYGPGNVQLSSNASGWTLGGPSIDTNNTYMFGGAMQFQLDQTLDHADFVKLFDRYRITGVKVTIIPLAQPNSPGTINLGITNYPTICYAVDNDDASVPSTWETLAAKQNAKVRRLDKPFSIYIHKPKIADAIYNGTTTAYRQGTGFIDCNNNDVPHYGLKFYIRECALPTFPQGSTSGSNQLIRIQTKFYLSMKDPQ